MDTLHDMVAQYIEERTTEISGPLINEIMSHFSSLGYERKEIQNAIAIFHTKHRKSSVNEDT